MNDWFNKPIFEKITGCDNPNAYWSFKDFLRILTLFCAAAVAALGGVVYVCYRLWVEIRLEISYRQKYGANWQAEYERYHGSLAQTHLRLSIVLGCLLALLTILLWFGWQFFKKHRNRRHHHTN